MSTWAATDLEESRDGVVLVVQRGRRQVEVDSVLTRLPLRDQTEQDPEARVVGRDEGDLVVGLLPDVPAQRLGPELGEPHRIVRIEEPRRSICACHAGHLRGHRSEPCRPAWASVRESVEVGVQHRDGLGGGRLFEEDGDRESEQERQEAGRIGGGEVDGRASSVRMSASCVAKKPMRPRPLVNISLARSAGSVSAAAAKPW